MTSQSDMAANAAVRGRDGFFKEIYRFFDALSKNRAMMAVVLVVVVGVCVAGGLMLSQGAAKSETGLNALYLAQKSYESELKKMAGVQPPKAAKPVDGKAESAAAKEAAAKAERAVEEAAGKRMDDLAFAKFDVDAKFPEAAKKFRDVIAQYGGTRAAHEARMALGTLYFNHGEAAKATPLFEDAVKHAPNSAEKAMAYDSLGYSLENEGKTAEAISAFEKSAGYADGSLKGDALLSLARNYETSKDAAKARSTYDQILSQLPNTDAARTAESLKAKL